MKYLSKDYKIINIKENEFDCIGIEKGINNFNVCNDNLGVIESFSTNEEARVFVNWLILCLDGRTHMLYGDFLGHKDEGNK
jgi:hypothetical protein